MGRGTSRLYAAWVVALSLAVGCAARPNSTSPSPSARPDAVILTDAVWAGDLPRMRALLAANADPAAIDAAEWPPWTWTLVTRDRPARDLLLAGTRDIHPDDPQTLSAFRTAVGQGDVDLVRELLRRHVPVDAPSEGRASPLLIAASNGDLPMLDVLLAAGAAVNLADGNGDTPLMAAVRAGAQPCADRLRARGADESARDREGRTARDWAPKEPAAAAVPTAAVAVARSIPVVQRGAAEWTRRVGCSSCHHQPMALLVTTVAERAGVSFDRAMAKALADGLANEELRFQAESRKALASDVGVLRAGRLNSGDIAFGTGLFLAARLEAGVSPGGPEETSAALLARLQLADGHWRYGPLRGAMESSDLATTALAARVIAALAPRGEDTQRRVARAKAWLIGAEAVTVVDHAYRLFGLRWTNADAAFVAAETMQLRALQRRDGGFGHLPAASSDAFSTGLALVALHEAGGVPAADPAYRLGVDYLLRRQDADGTWRVPSRAVPLLPYTDGGSPHGKFQFISFAGTCWSTMALLYAVAPVP
jgi:hypothetical protein